MPCVKSLYPPEKELLHSMVDCLYAGPQIYWPSEMWRKINERHMQELEEFGFENFKRTVNNTYFNFIQMRHGDPQLQTLLRWWYANFTLRVFLSKMADDGLDFVFKKEKKRFHFFRRERNRFFYKLFVTLLWEFTKKEDRFSLLECLEEPVTGNPFRIKYGGRLISQDICNSILEFNAIFNHMEGAEAVPRRTIMELGGGGGRFGYVLLNALDCRYLDFDIPPALYIAQKYLSACFPNKRIFPFRQFSSFSEIERELGESDIAFFTPNQLELFPEKYFDLAINISSLGEMHKEQIRHYLNLMDKLTRSFFYMKQWMRSVNHFDKIVVCEEDYPMPDAWVRIYRRVHPIQKGFYESLFRIK